MKTTSFASFFAIVFATLLTACGGQYDVQSPAIASAPYMQVMASATSAGTATPAAAPPATQAAANTVPVVTAANMPAPDCAADGCAGLRIIDGNAEAWRVDAARRAAFEARL